MNDAGFVQVIDGGDDLSDVSAGLELVESLAAADTRHEIAASTHLSHQVVTVLRLHHLHTVIIASTKLLHAKPGHYYLCQV